jgi:hypothetical protein
MTLAVRRDQGDEGSLPIVLASPGETQVVNWVVGSTTSMRNAEKGRAKGAEKQPAEEWCQPPVHWQQWDAAAEKDQVKGTKKGWAKSTEKGRVKGAEKRLDQAPVQAPGTKSVVAMRAVGTPQSPGTVGPLHVPGAESPARQIHTHRCIPYVMSTAECVFLTKWENSILVSPPC